MPTVLTKDIMTIVEQDGRSLTVLDRYNNLIVIFLGDGWGENVTLEVLIKYTKYFHYNSKDIIKLPLNYKGDYKCLL